MRTAVASRIVPLGLLVALAACQAGIPRVGAPIASSSARGTLSRTAGSVRAGHLYVATVTASRQLTIGRYRLHNGIPASSPDRVYQGYSGLIAVSGNGTLYSTIALSPIVVDVFPSGSDKPVRKISIEPACHFSSSGFNVVNAIAADASGYLFVLIYSYPGAALRVSRGGGPSPDTRTPCNGIAIYAPNARGRARPVQAIRLSNTAELDGLAVDASDNLYVSGGSAVNEYSNAVVDPKQTRTFSGKYLGDVRSVATDPAGDVFIANAEQSYSSGWIDRYSPSASGGGPPTSTIYLQGSGPHLLYSMAVQRRYLYADDTAKSVEVYRARKNGPQSPIYSLPEPKVDSVAVGP